MWHRPSLRIQAQHKRYVVCLSLFLVFRGFDKDNDGCISVIEWVYGLSVFLRGTLEEKMKCKISRRPTGLYFMISRCKECASVWWVSLLFA